MGVLASSGVSRSKRAAMALLCAATIAVVTWSVVRWAYRPAPTGDLHHALDRTLADFFQSNRPVRNCVISVMSGDGSLVWSGAAGSARENVAMTSDTPIYIASVTKLYTATAVMRLAEQRRLTLDDPMAKYLPKELIDKIQVYQGRDYTNAITLRGLLAHRTGIPDYYSEKAGDGKSLFELFVEDPGRSWTPEQTIARARDELKPAFAPDTQTSYSDTYYQLLGKVIERVTGKPLEVVFEEFFFEPLGLRHTWMVGHCRPSGALCPLPAQVFLADRDVTATRSNGAYWADGGIVSTAAEMNVFLKALREGGLIRQESLDEMHEWKPMSRPLEYGYGTMRFELPWPVRALTGIPVLWGHSGSTGSFLYYSQDFDLYVAGTTDQIDGKMKPFLLIGRAIQTVNAESRSSGARRSGD
ncbi:MAG TPA: serine hydrolase domain-containing protein [Acidobacteriaceae bacterium]|jgi:CubicO group peptidase (beta-lactamase class C family)|nr:serine hydrolase domain-containing protein [Acidobacteriaceae bacterium]